MSIRISYELIRTDAPLAPSFDSCTRKRSNLAAAPNSGSETVSSLVAEPGQMGKRTVPPGCISRWMGSSRSKVRVPASVDCSAAGANLAVSDSRTVSHSRSSIVPPLLPPLPLGTVTVPALYLAAKVRLKSYAALTSLESAFWS